ncbi:MAG: FAD-dependent oxidoreductase [Candidatus Rokuibacteriota bacterium]|nr:MAG: FAD-dependent oxidoreductase [Candidatus Rokubacteria bacterium]
MSRRVNEERPGFPGALRALGGVGGHVGAPHVIDARSLTGKAARPDRHVPLVVVGAGPAGVAAAVEAARAGVEVLLVDEHPVDNDMMAMDVPLYFGGRMQPAVRNRSLMLERVVESNPALAAAAEAGVDVQVGTYVWAAFVPGPTFRELDGPLLGLADERRSWLVGYERLIVAAGARDVVLGFPGWERAGVMGAHAAAALLTRYRALAARRMVVLGSGEVGLRTAALAVKHGVEVAAIVEVADAVRGDDKAARALADAGVPILTSHTVREARGRTGEVESVVLVSVDGEAKPITGTEREIACDTVCLALGLAPSVELLALAGARLRFSSALGGWVPEIDGSMRTSAAGVFAAGDCAGVHGGRLGDADLARSQGRLAGLAAAESLGALRPAALSALRASAAVPAAAGAEVHGHWRAWLRSLIQAGGWDVNVCQCEEVTRRELVETRPPRYLAWDSAPMSARNLGTLLRDGPINQDQIKRLTRAGMGPCQSRRCREQVGLLLAEATATPVERIPLPTFRPPIRPLPLNVLWPADEPPAMREDWVSWFGIPTQFSPHWEAGMAIDEPTAHGRLIVSEE